MKTLDQYFADWEGNAFGFGYGTGEDSVLGALKDFMEHVPAEGSYDYNVLQEACGPAVAWLLINALCKDDAIDYGTSPRFGWLTKGGLVLREYVRSHSVDELVQATIRSADEYGCSPDACNCGPEGYDPALICPNPFWGRT